MWQRTQAWFVRNRHDITQCAVVLVVFQIFRSLGQITFDYCNVRFGVANMNTPYFLGRSGRSPMHPYIPMPYDTDYEAMVEYNRYKAILDLEGMLTYKNFMYRGFVHPQREYCDYAAISDAEIAQDIDQLLEE